MQTQKKDLDVLPAATNAAPSVPATVENDNTAVIQMIERAVRDPAVNIDKLERMIALQERVLAKQNEQAFNAAMASAQADMRRVAADSNNPQTKSRYASYAALDRALRPIYTQHGFGLSFNTVEGAPDDFVRVTCDVSHNAGFTKHYRIDMPADGKGAKGGDVMTKTHATGAAVTYGMRYLLKMIFNVAIGEDDDDGNSASGETINSEQITELQTLLTNSGAPKDKFLKHMKIETLVALPANKFDDAKAAINTWIANRKAKEAAAQ